MQRRSSLGSSRASSLRVDNRSNVDQRRRSSVTDPVALTEFRKICKLCTEPINAGTIVTADGFSWHSDCFKCKVCRGALTDYHAYDDNLYCFRCSSEMTGVCSVCHNFLGNTYVISNDIKYHSGCFRCTQCNLPLGSKEHYTLCEEGQIICDNCHESNKMSLIGIERLVEVKWGDLQTRMYPNAELRVVDVLGSSQESTPNLRKNDIIIAINANGIIIDPTNRIHLDPEQRVILTVSQCRSRLPSDTSSPPSPPPPSTRPHKRRMLRPLSSSPPPCLGSPPAGSTSYIFSPSQVEVGPVIGRGFFGRVCAAKLLETGELICLKELQQVGIASANAFIDEVALLKNLKHVNVLAFKGIVSSPPSFSLLTEYVGGGTLRSLIKHIDKDIPWSRRLDIALGVSSGMSYLHSREIIHRDLTSKNCLLRLDGTVVVADFGLAQHHQASHYTWSYLSPPVAPVKKRNDSVGAVYWRAPEMILDKPYDYKVDIFSYGIVMCELIARIKANPDYLPRSIEDWGLNESAFRELVPEDCPEPFLQVVVQCCCVTPELRPPFPKICDFLTKFINSTDVGDFNDALFSITRTLHSICEDG